MSMEELQGFLLTVFMVSLAVGLWGAQGSDNPGSALVITFLFSLVGTLVIGVVMYAYYFSFWSFVNPALGVVTLIFLVRAAFLYLDRPSESNTLRTY